MDFMVIPPLDQQGHAICALISLRLLWLIQIP